MRQFAARSWRPELEASARAARVRAVDAGWLAGAALFAAGCGVLRESRVDRLWAPPAAEEVPALRAHLNRSPSDLHAVFRLASAYHSAARLEESRRLLELLLRRDPADAGATFLLGLTYEDLGLYPEARSLYERYIASADSERLARELRRRLPVIERLELRSAARSALAREPELIGAPPAPRTVAVFPFLYADVDPLLRPLGRAVSEVLAADLARASGLTVVRPERVQSLLAEMGLAARGRIDQAAGARAARLLGAELAVQGWITGGSERLTLSASIQGVGGRDAAVTQFSATSVPAQTLDLEKQLALSVFRRLGVDLSAPEWERVLNLATRDFGALLAFGRGTEALDAGDYAEAARALRRAAELDPAFELAGERARLAAEAAAAAATSTRQLSFAYWLEAGAAARKREAVEEDDDVVARAWPGAPRSRAGAAGPAAPERQAMEMLLQTAAPAGAAAATATAAWTPAPAPGRNLTQSTAGEGVQVEVRSLPIELTRPRPAVVRGSQR